MEGINLNDFIKFKLTNEGEMWLEEYCEESFNPELTREVYFRYDKKGYLQMQIWQFANVFGKFFTGGACPATRDNVVYKKKKAR